MISAHERELWYWEGLGDDMDEREQFEKWFNAFVVREDRFPCDLEIYEAGYQKGKQSCECGVNVMAGDPYS